MAVYFTGGGGGRSLFGSLLGLASLAVPGFQNIAPYVAGGLSLIRGDIPGAVSSIGGKLIGDAMDRTHAMNLRNEANRDSLFGSLLAASRRPEDDGNPWTAFRRRNLGFPDFDTDPVTGERQSYIRPWEGF